MPTCFFLRRIPTPRPWCALVLLAGSSLLAPGEPLAAHIVPPESLHPVAASYRRLEFGLNLNPVHWETIHAELRTLDGELDAMGAEVGIDLERLAADASQEAGSDTEGELAADKRRRIAHRVLSETTRAIARAIRADLRAAGENLADYTLSAERLERARQMWAAFEPAIEAAQPSEFVRLGECWLALASALGHPGLGGVGQRAPDQATFLRESRELVEHLEAHFTDSLQIPQAGRLAPLPGVERDDYPPGKRLPPGFNINKQIPRPRQILGMATRGVDERDTPLIALGDMAFDTALIFGEPARSLAITCNTCHNKGVTNPNFFIPGLSRVPGGMDVSNSFFGAHANNGVFDPLDIPDLRGLRFTAPYGRNGRFDSLREFTRNVIVGEFSGAEPEPLLLDGLVAYMLEFEFLPNPALRPDGRLTAETSLEARRGETLFFRPFAQMGDRSCATCHIPSDHFLDRRRHDIGTVAGSEAASRDRALDTPTLLGTRYSAPYFHDGRFATLAEVVAWFNEEYSLNLTDHQQADLTEYLETVGDGVEAYEDTVHTLASELEEFDFFLAPYELLKERGEKRLIDITFGTVAFEIRAHKWDVQDPSNLPVLDQLAGLMDGAREALANGRYEEVDRIVADYRTLYRAKAEVLE